MTTLPDAKKDIAATRSKRKAKDKEIGPRPIEMSSRCIDIFFDPKKPGAFGRPDFGEAHLPQGYWFNARGAIRTLARSGDDDIEVTLLSTPVLPMCWTGINASKGHRLLVAHVCPRHGNWVQSEIDYDALMTSRKLLSLASMGGTGSDDSTG